MQKNLDRKTVLIVDDEASIRSLLQRYFQKSGFSVFLAGSGEEAIQSFRKHCPNVVLLDIGMPGIDGLETLRQMRLLYSECKVIIVSAVNDEEIFRRCLELGALDYLVKPIELDYLGAKIMGRLLK